MQSALRLRCQSLHSTTQRHCVTFHVRSSCCPALAWQGTARHGTAGSPPALVLRASLELPRKQQRRPQHASACLAAKDHSARVSLHQRQLVGAGQLQARADRRTQRQQRAPSCACLRRQGCMGCKVMRAGVCAGPFLACMHACMRPMQAHLCGGCKACVDVGRGHGLREALGGAGGEGGEHAVAPAAALGARHRLQRAARGHHVLAVRHKGQRGEQPAGQAAGGRADTDKVVGGQGRAVHMLRERPYQPGTTGSISQLARASCSLPCPETLCSMQFHARTHASTHDRHVKKTMCVCMWRWLPHSLTPSLTPAG